ncbi:hypothetical protein ACFB49_30290 [Sphingomonas sp. DBB INV C78]|uniref:MucR family transcriptional regulator n=1 Tax=Sphingomonas sp. DBB INV C78 TaxID=3349434 RepID=UPI0036D38B54
MSDQPGDEKRNPIELATEITIAWLNNPNSRVSADDVPAFFQKMHSTIMEIGKAVKEAVEVVVEHLPAVPIRSSVKPDHLVSLIDGTKLKTLKRHLAKHGLTPATYRERFGLKADYPMVASSYAEMRREVAKRVGLGRKSTTAKVTTPDAGTASKPVAVKPKVGNGTVAQAATPAPSKAKSAAKPKAIATKPASVRGKGAALASPAVDPIVASSVIVAKASKARAGKPKPAAPVAAPAKARTRTKARTVAAASAPSGATPAVDAPPVPVSAEVSPASAKAPAKLARKAKTSSGEATASILKAKPAAKVKPETAVAPAATKAKPTRTKSAKANAAKPVTSRAWPVVRPPSGGAPLVKVKAAKAAKAATAKTPNTSTKKLDDVASKPAEKDGNPGAKPMVVARPASISQPVAVSKPRVKLSLRHGVKKA